MTPAVDIAVDEATGRWTSDGLPMVFTPRHFFMSLVEAMEEALGREAAERRLYEAGFRSAETWCRIEAARNGTDPLETVRFYLQRLSERGWGLFDLADYDPETGEGRVILRHSTFVEHHGRDAGRKVCGLAAGWAPGALSGVLPKTARHRALHGAEVHCAAEGHDHCEFRIFPAA